MKIAKIWLALAIAPLAAALLQGCGAAVVGGAALGVSVLHDRRDSGTVLEDERIEFTALDTFMEDEPINQHSRISVTSYNYVALLTGQADSPAIKARAAQIVQAIPKVRRVVDEVEVAPNAAFPDESTDAYLTSRVKVALFELIMPDFDPTRVKVVTEQSVVYLMGLLTPAEAEAVVETVRNIRGVKRVVKIFEYIEPKPAT
jgi:osmotically-inducible protein OsmY